MALGSPITDEERKEYEEFIKKYPPYEDDDPVMQVFDDPSADLNRVRATTLKALLDGKLG